MKVNHSKSIRFAIATALAVGTCQIAGAVGLGPISVNSHIGEPLQASIRVNGLSSSDAANTKIKIADAAAYQSRGITKLPSHDGLRFGLTRAGNGYIITVRSNQQIREPFINFLLSMNSGGEEIVREYAVFLDPAAGGAMPATLTEPVGETEAPAPAPAAPEGKLLDIEPASSTSVGWQGKSAAPAKPVAVAPAAAPQASWNGKTYGPVQPGETLYSIASKVRPSENYSIQSVMRQIFRANRSAFSSHSLSSLMAGYTLRIPEFRQGAVAMPAKPKRSKTYQPAPQRKATPPSPATNNTADTEATEGDQVQEQMQDQVQDNAPQAADEEAVQPSLLNEQVQDAQEAVEEAAENVEAAVTEAVEAGDSAVTEAMSDAEEALAGETEETVAATGEVEGAEAAVNNDDVMPETVMVDETTESVPPVDVQPPLIAEESSVPESTPEVVAPQPEPEPVQAAVPANSEPVTPPPAVDEEEDKGFLFTTYAILPMWQWLAISGAALVLIALLLFRQRRKSVDIDDEEDGLDADEMEAVLAKINAMDDDDDSPYAPAGQHHDFDEQTESWEDENFAEADDDIFAQETAHAEPSDVSLHKPRQPASGTDDSADFLFDDEVPAKADTAADDFDFLEEQNNAAAKPASKKQKPAEDDFFAEDDVNWEDLGAAATPEKADKPAAPAEKKPAAKPQSSGSGDADWLDDLVFEGEEAPARKAKPASTTPSSDEMEINLDLASSFIATGHGERAVSWLEEVIEMGSAEQKARAEELMAKVRNA